MTKYRVAKASFINNRFYNAGEVLEYEGEVSNNLVELGSKAEKAAKAAIDEEIAKNEPPSPSIVKPAAADSAQGEELKLEDSLT